MGKIWRRKGGGQVQAVTEFGMAFESGDDVWGTFAPFTANFVPTIWEFEISNDADFSSTQFLGQLPGSTPIGPIADGVEFKTYARVRGIFGSGPSAKATGWLAVTEVLSV